ncbi:MAG: HAMP domain-containing protein [Clostridia bacterium]|nr:HAMP domain-containing protein [Clostridia bacterium]
MGKTEKTTGTGSLTGKLVRMAAIPTIIVFVAAVIILQISLSSQVRNEMDEKLLLMAENTNMQTEAFFSQFTHITEQTAQDAMLIGMLSDIQLYGKYFKDNWRCGDVLKTMAGAVKGKEDKITEFYAAPYGDLNDWVTSLGEVMSRDCPDAEQIKKKEWITMPRDKGTTCYLPPYLDEYTQVVVCTITTPVYSPDGRYLGCAGVDIKLTDMQNMFAETAVGDTGYVVVCLEDGTVFYSPNEEDIGKNIEDTSFSQGMKDTVLQKNDGEAFEFLDGSGTEMIGAIKAIGDTGWSLVSCMSQAEAYDMVSSARTLQITTLLIALVIILLSIFFVTSRALRPVSEVAKEAGRLAEGDISMKIEHRSKVRDEVDLLVNAFAEVVENNKRQAENLERVAEGDTSVNVEVRSQRDALNISMKKVVDTLTNLASETNELTERFASGDSTFRADASKFEGGYKALMLGLNKTIETILAQIQTIMDSIPMPVQILDSNRNWTSVNKAFSEPLVRAGLAESPESFAGKPCRIEGADICRVDDLLNGEKQTRIKLLGRQFMQTMDYLKNQKGEVIGYLGAFNDMTEILAKNEYSDIEIERLRNNLHNLAVGKFEFDTVKQPVNEYTREVAESFDAINTSANEVTEAVAALIEDAMMMGRAAVEGDWDARADVSRHQGKFAEVMEDVNGIVDALTAPMHECLRVLEEVARGNLGEEVTGDYKGDNRRTKEALNETTAYLKATISEINFVLGRIAAGDLTVTIADKYFKGDFTEIKEALDEILSNLTDMIRNLNEASDQVATGSKQLSEASQTLADGATRQASAVHQLSSSITSIAEKTKQNAIDASSASSLTQQVKAGAEIGNMQMQDMLQSMEEINESSVNISSIIKVIQDIAFQTNILALNAAVEAVRAGEHGKGFSVVAEEVRSLAARSADAAKDTTELIEGSIKKVGAGMDIARETAHALAEILKGVENATELIAGIASASNEQASSVHEINKGIDDVAHVIQRISSTAEESASSSEELYGQADSLRKMVSEFKVDDSQPYIPAELLTGGDD